MSLPSVRSDKASEDVLFRPVEAFPVVKELMDAGETSLEGRLLDAGELFLEECATDLNSSESHFALFLPFFYKEQII